MTDTTGALPPAGWYPDPYGAPFDRWWDGQQWTEHTNAPVVPEPVAPVQPEPAPYVPPALEEPYVAPTTADPFAGFATPITEPAAQQPVAHQAPAAAQPYVPPAQSHDAPPASAFDFGFGALISGEIPSNTAAGAPTQESTGDGESGLFGSWTPNEYVEPPRNGQANAGLALGILSFFLSVLAGIPGLILSALGVRQASRFDQDGDGPVGRGKAIAGIVLSVIGTATSIALISFGLHLLNPTQPGTPADNGAGAPSADDANLTQNGGIPLDIGATGTITLPDSQSPAIQFTVTAITPNFTCTAADSVSPTNGQFVAIAMDITTDAKYLTRMDSGAPLHMNQADWIGFLGDENGTQVVNTDAGTSCIAPGEQFPSDLEAGKSVSGTIVLDMSADVASLSWGPSGVTNLDPGITRWEWAMPAS
jgi:hypothetical protein